VTIRVLLLVLCLSLTSVYLAYARRLAPTPVRQPLAELPLRVDEFHGRDEPSFTPEILAELGVDDYIVRSYNAPDRGWVSLYVGFHSRQQHGDTIHSPLNCLPGAGWIPLEHTRKRLLVSDLNGRKQEIEVNRVLIEKGLDRRMVLYWYQSHGRVIASEYVGKIFTVVDSIRLGRTDAALVRVSVPLEERDAEAAARSEATATAFVTALFPMLERHLPL
jgi:EpsI family protein